MRWPERAGIAAHGMLFVPPAAQGSSRHPAVVFMHGGPVRQMLAGWQSMDADRYSNAYALGINISPAEGFVVLSLNYRGRGLIAVDLGSAKPIGWVPAAPVNTTMCWRQLSF